MIIIFTGDGKGKTSAAIGTILRAIQNNKNVVLVQVLKTGRSSEIKLLKSMLSNAIQPFNHMVIESFGQEQFIHPDKTTELDRTIIAKAKNYISQQINNKPFLLVIDEVLVALKFKLITEEYILALIKKCRSNDIHLVLTGRGATQEIINQSDLVTDMKNIKHPFDEGVQGIEGIDF